VAHRGEDLFSLTLFRLKKLSYKAFYFLGIIYKNKFILGSFFGKEDGNIQENV
jgi:hypothetical protein